LSATTTATAATTTATRTSLAAFPAFTLCVGCLCGGCRITHDHGRVIAARCGARIGSDLVSRGGGTDGRSGCYGRGALAIAAMTLVTRTT
jgi:hypothetical protein